MSFENARKADHKVAKMFIDRWSPRAFSDHRISDEELFSLFEAARWAPSAYNAQPWRFAYAKAGEAQFETMQNLLVPGNASWAKKAAALVFLASKSTLVPPGATAEQPSYSHSFDAGAAWAYLALQAADMGWCAHAMVGFDHGRARTQLNVPEGWRLECAIAIGKRGDAASLPEALRARETPNQRASCDSFCFHGAFPKE
jgi:nitroreductase